ncbi:extracellular solute-binding protein [Butyrivibrio sp. MC2013]|uniref:extracellular solute-binding protein n=1 Tax=Butyrivibrio sp. MC2013 TaxID=1280686 RepID=UPI00047A57A6|nr:extracellular solute-binding protein [Butyrivibrio sp. MC2013]
MLGTGRGSARILACIISAGLLLESNMDVYAREIAEDEELKQYYTRVYESIDYKDYLEGYTNVSHPEHHIVIPGTDYSAADCAVNSSDWYEGRENVLLTPEEGSVSWECDIPEGGLYKIFIDYYPTEGKGNTIERELYINGQIPFEEAGYLEFVRNWTSENLQKNIAIEQDPRGNDIKPRQLEEPVWREQCLKDIGGYVSEGFDFYLQKGTNTITLNSVREPMAIASLSICQADDIPTYDEYILNASGANDAHQTIKLQGEDARYKSESVLTPVNDRTSPKTEPYDPSKIRMNAIGGSNWSRVGQWISWEIDVPEDGLYEIAIKYKQGIKQGATVCRSLRLDDKLPFKEAGEISFHYKNEWQIMKLGREDIDYKFYLTKGRHSLSLEVTLGQKLSDILDDADSSIAELNTAYRQLLMVIGTSPDVMRDYQLELKCPEALDTIREQYGIIGDLSKRVEEYACGSKAGQTAVLDNLSLQLGNMTKDPQTIPKYWSSFKDNIIALASWSLSMKEQPLMIDYLMLMQPGDKLPESAANIGEKIGHEVRAFASSFSEDYESIGDVYEGDPLEVWLLADPGTVAGSSGSGRDQASILKDLVDNYFVSQKDIPVNVKLVNRDNLLSATLAGRGPDLALSVWNREPVNYALRNAVEDLSSYPDFEQVRGRFIDGALDMFTYDGGVYALPYSTSFPVMFYRADILEELGLEVPQTWDDFYACLAVIQKSNMNVGILPDYTSYGMMLYQYGGAYYSEDGSASGLSSEEAVRAFSQWTGNYADYKMPVSYDFANRFRTGEMPLGIADYTVYSYLSVFAPEIKGLWGFTIVPGHEREDGSVDHSVIAGQMACVVLKDSDHKDEAWEFLKWWSSCDIQTQYATEIENVLGVAGRVATPNMEALENLPWSHKDLKQLLAQMGEVHVVPEVPGGYFTERHVRNAFYEVYNDKEDPRETLEEYVKTINNEITSKRIEFGLDITK